MNYLIASFYKFFDFVDYSKYHLFLLHEMEEAEIKGTILLSPEGINSTISGPTTQIKKFLANLSKLETNLNDLQFTWSEYHQNVFAKSKVKLKKQILDLGTKINLTEQPVGEYVSGQDWNSLITDSQTLVIDVRNNYEVAQGTFPRAQNPQTTTFKEIVTYAEQLQNQKKQKIAMFCTGGIRCEKFSAYLLQENFEQVFHLKGGILGYLQDIKPNQSLWQGSCFVFDQRKQICTN